jgi:hypothetical protein
VRLSGGRSSCTKTASVATSALVRIALKESFLGDERNFLGPLMRFARGDVRDHMFHTETATDLRIGARERCSGRDG